jgi:hypothetical protein
MEGELRAAEVAAPCPMANGSDTVDDCGRLDATLVVDRADPASDGVGSVGAAGAARLQYRDERRESDQVSGSGGGCGSAWPSPGNL